MSELTVINVVSQVNLGPNGLKLATYSNVKVLNTNRSSVSVLDAMSKLTVINVFLEVNMGPYNKCLAYCTRRGHNHYRGILV